MACGEFRRYPLLIAEKMRILITRQETKISCMLYKLLHTMHLSIFTPTFG